MTKEKQKQVKESKRGFNPPITQTRTQSLYMCFGGERRLGVRLRRARGLMGRDEVAIFPSSLPMRPRARLNLTPNLLSPSLKTHK